MRRLNLYTHMTIQGQAQCAHSLSSFQKSIYMGVEIIFHYLLQSFTFCEENYRKSVQN